MQFIHLRKRCVDQNLSLHTMLEINYLCNDTKLFCVNLYYHILLYLWSNLQQKPIDFCQPWVKWRCASLYWNIRHNTVVTTFPGIPRTCWIRSVATGMRLPTCCVYCSATAYHIRNRRFLRAEVVISTVRLIFEHTELRGKRRGKQTKTCDWGFENSGTLYNAAWFNWMFVIHLNGSAYPL